MIHRIVALGVCALLGTAAASARSLPPSSATGAPRPLAPRNEGACAAFGPGFVKVPGSDTCVKLGGSVRVEMGVNSAGGSFVPSGR